MKIAVISDIHGNLPALEAVWKDLLPHEPACIYCLGDLVNFAGWDNEVVDFIRERHIPAVLGNHDEGIGQGRDSFGFSFESEEQRLFGIHSIAQVNRSITPRNRAFLNDLPFSISLSFGFPFHNMRIMLTHGSPLSNRDYVEEDTEEMQLIELLDEASAEILVLGHTHRPFHRAIYAEEGNQKQYRHIINAGSVGKPKHGDNKACYVILDILDSITVHFHYVAYDTGKVIGHIHSLGLGNAYDSFLETGITKHI
jgi:predicted phosphodiesterase